MKVLLKEKKDFVLIGLANKYGFSFFYPVINNIQLEGVRDPKIGDIVYQCNETPNGEKTLQLVLIKDGQYFLNGRINNCWRWHELDKHLNVVHEAKHGYGHFFRPLEKFNIELKIKKI